MSTPWTVARHRVAGPGVGAGIDPDREEARYARSCLSATSPRKAPSPAPRCWSTWSTRCCISRASARHQFRILRAVKNRFGPADEIGVFEMTDARPGRGHESRRRCSSVSGPRRRRVGRRPSSAGMEGTQPGAGGNPSTGGAARASATPRRAVIGWDTGRLAMVTAVLGSPMRRDLRTRKPLDVYLERRGGI